MKPYKYMKDEIILLDRDGVINKDPAGWTKHSYVTSPDEFQFLPGSLEALKLLFKNKFKVIVISNQAGVAKGYFTRHDLQAVTRKMISEVANAGGKIEEVSYCVHRDEDRCNCRKPRTGMLEAAIRKYRARAKDLYFIGDGVMDVIAGNKMGVNTVFVTSGKTSLEEMKKSGEKPDYIFPNLLSAVVWILARISRKEKRAYKRENEERQS